MTHNPGIPPRKADRNSAGARELDAMAKAHAKADATRDMGSEAPAPPTGLAASRGSSASSFGHAAIPARFQSHPHAPAPKASGHATAPATVASSRPSATKRTAKRTP